MKRKTLLLIGSILTVLIISIILIAPYLPINLDWREFNRGYKLEEIYDDVSLENPVGIYFAGNDSSKVFVVEQTGKIKVFENSPNVNSHEVFLDVSGGDFRSGGETGLLGMAFHPNYKENGYVFVDYTLDDPLRTRISRFELSSDDPNILNKTSERIILEVNQPYSNHNAGAIAFGPDGYLYITLGDGGSGGDPQGNGQDKSTLLGSILRVDIDNETDATNYAIPTDNPFVNEDDVRSEIWAYGLRNPWRMSFDNSGRLWAGDVGQSSYEEIDIIEKGGNYGWNIMEATHCFEPEEDCDNSGLILPVAEYGRDLGKSVTGGYVYYGTDEPNLYEHYIFGDYLSGRIWYLDGSNPYNADKEVMLKQNILISSFGITPEGEVLVVNLEGQIFDIVEEDG